MPVTDTTEKKEYYKCLNFGIKFLIKFVLEKPEFLIKIIKVSVFCSKSKLIKSLFEATDATMHFWTLKVSLVGQV